MLTEIERLTAIEEIKQLKARYFRCMDTKDWAGLQAVFSDDAEFDMRGEAADKSKAARIINGPSFSVVFVIKPSADSNTPLPALGFW